LLLQLALLLLVGRAFGEVMHRARQPAVMGNLLAGVALGPTVLGTLWPSLQHAIFPAQAESKAMIEAIGGFGVLMLLLLTGMETDLKLVRRVGRAAIVVPAAGIAIPLASGVALGEVLPASLLLDPSRRFVTSLFIGTALSISSVKIVALVI